MGGSLAAASLFDSIGRELGLKAKGSELAEKHRPAIEVDSRVWAAIGNGGTPAFFINGQFLGGAQPEEKFRAVIDQEMARAREKIKAGTRPEDVYKALQDEVGASEED